MRHIHGNATNHQCNEGPRCPPPAGPPLSDVISNREERKSYAKTEVPQPNVQKPIRKQDSCKDRKLVGVPRQTLQ